MINKEKKFSIKKFFSEKSSRRDFLKWIGFSTASVTLAACKGPVIKSIPYVVKPEEIVLGEPIYYASTMIDSFDIGCVLVKTREGRPIKIEPNYKSTYFNNVSVRIQSSLLSLYDEERLKYPYIKGKKSNWESIDDYIINNLNFFKKKQKKIIFITPSLPSFSTKKLINDFKKNYPNTEWIIYDPISYSKALNASKEIFGIRNFPFFNIKNIKLIVSFDADFLLDWYPGSMVKYYTKNRDPNKNMLKHIHIESNMSLSGSNADIRISKKPSEIKKMLFNLYQKIVLGKNNIMDKETIKIYNLIKKFGNESVIFSDGDQESYELSFLINKEIKSNAINHNKFFLSKNSDDDKFKFFVKNSYNKNIGALFIYDLDPIYSLPYPLSNKFRKLIKKTPMTVSFSMNKNETNKLTDIIAPIPHWLESWGDTNPISNYYTLIQPTIKNIFNTRQFQDSLIIWGKIKNKNYYQYLKNEWESNIIPKSNYSSFNECLFYGYLNTKDNNSSNTIISNKNHYKIKHIKKINKINNNSLELRLYTKVNMGDGNQYNNPWIQEFPDPITRTTWGNYLTISDFDAKNNNLKNWYKTDGTLHGNCVDLIKDNKIFIKNIPIFIQPGQSNGSIGIALGYGQKIGKLSNLCNGKNSYVIYKNFNINQYNIYIKKTNKIHKFACIQLQNTSLNRNLVKKTNLNTFLNFPKNVWNKKEEEKISNKFLDKNKEIKGHHFNLSIDLNSCIGCGTCVIACHSENNVPVVGRNEIENSRDMHWIRIDRYYSDNTVNNYDNSNKKENINVFNVNPKISFQPIMCQHCEYAPCETVCPVAATTHSTQGQNMMTYNRCVGTRYCANNCPYKVRRFNWFDYANNKKFDFNMNNKLGKMVLNPDVVIRSRGVMEKCSLCIQKTQYSIGIAKKEKRKVKDEEFETACSISCPTDAITFGDINDKNSKISKKLNNSRSYKLLDFIGINPNVNYLLKINNIENDE
ncbi:4Fe-4S dicluster domain-containing protein [Blattabacterium cuenoti]|uniref:4Fe-4S dicluster domain-containing protein n=1 Tax=Blattabacterium cuenoti TaxID=1653831 RepID=UPI00163BDD6B|nr:4Fe-4S dicluster domain-containing protein [Blattabacterium cuenoti]